jgi:hypothetical protein
VTTGDGDYLLVLKLSEVYFNAPNMKVRKFIGTDIQSINAPHRVTSMLPT